jgi:hypothetical protein
MSELTPEHVLAELFGGYDAIAARDVNDLAELVLTRLRDAGFEVRSAWPPSSAGSACAPNDAVSSVMAEAYGMIGLELTVPQARRLANAAINAPAQAPSAVPAIVREVLQNIVEAKEPKPEGRREPDDHDWNVQALEFQRIAKLALNALNASPQTPGTASILHQADELHDLGFNAGWNGAVEECAKEAERLHEKPGWSPNYKNAALKIAGMIRALSRPQRTCGFCGGPLPCLTHSQALPSQDHSQGE